MEFGFNVPVRGPAASAEGLAAIARRAEQFGYGYIAVTDHIVVPRDIGSRYPYSEDGAFPGRSGEYLEPLSVMPFLAAVTEKIRLLTSVMVVPHRPAVLAAKMIATIDVLSGGRVILGCGAGWMREEFEAIAAPPYDARGRVTNEFIRAFRALWTEENPSFDGEHVKFSDIIFLPKPVQKPHPPIWTGGESPPALRRAAALADCWYPVGSNARRPLDTPARYGDAQAEVKRLAEAAGREAGTLDFAYWAIRPWTGEARQTDNGERSLFSGTATELIGDVKRLEDLGLRHLSLVFIDKTLAKTLANIERFADQVMAKL